VSRYPYDVLLAGIGMGGPEQATTELLRLLKKARIVYSLTIHEDWLRRQHPNVQSLDGLYYTGEHDSKVYDRLARLVLAEGARGGGVAVVDDGHPLIHDDVNATIVRLGQRRRLRVRVLPAISALDMLVARYGVPFDATGLQIVEATSLVTSRQKLNPHFETLVLQVGWFAQSLLVAVDGHRPERFGPLVQYLLRFYPPTHRVRILRAAQSSDDGVVRTCRLSSLARHHASIATDATLHIPALPSRRRAHPLRAKTEDAAHLARIAVVPGARTA
jgi:tetrapyrrole methylase family protein/MazG family protein